jgi:hypothetical protein
MENHTNTLYIYITPQFLKNMNNLITFLFFFFFFHLYNYQMSYFTIYKVHEETRWVDRFVIRSIRCQSIRIYF